MDWDRLWLWLARAGTLLFAFAAGWAFGRSVPTWEADAAQDAMDWQERYGPGWRFGWGRWDYMSYRPDWGALGCLMILSSFRGNLAGTLVSVLALVCTYFGWGIAENTWQAGLTLVLGSIIGYIAAVTTDKGPVGPLE